MGFSHNISSLRFEGRDISLSEWISLLTLTLAPILAHVVAGTPQPTVLSSGEPRWHDLICHYNPTSILWRYAAITDRRIKARAWNPGTLAATNALFWTGQGWEGSEETVARAMPYRTRLPRRTRLRFWSWETLKTLITTLQGIQVITIAFSNLTGPHDLTIGFGIESVFLPLSSLGLSRLLAATWLTDEYAFSAHEAVVTKAPLSRGPRISVDSLLECHPPENTSVDHFKPTTGWTSRLFRACYVFVLQGSVPIFMMYSLPGHQTVTTLLFLVLYLIIFSISVVLFTVYFIRGLTTTTIIPCISSTWYKAYSCALMCLIVTVVIIAGIQTRKTPCGKYTSWPAAYGDRLLCETKNSLLIQVGNKSDTDMFGLASRYPNSTIGTVLGEGEFWVDNFTGSCMGTWSDDSRRYVSTTGVIEVPGGKAGNDGGNDILHKNDTIWKDISEFECETE